MSLVVEGSAPATYISFYGMAAAQSYRFHYTADPETLALKTGDVYVLGEDGGETLFVHMEMVTSVRPEAPDLKAQARAATEFREIHVILDPGTEDEFDEVIDVPIDMGVAFQLPDGYALYADAACTLLYEDISPDENGEYPELSTFYAVPSND